MDGIETIKKTNQIVNKGGKILNDFILAHLPYLFQNTIFTKKFIE